MTYVSLISAEQEPTKVLGVSGILGAFQGVLHLPVAHRAPGKVEPLRENSYFSRFHSPIERVRIRASTGPAADDKAFPLTRAEPSLTEALPRLVCLQLSHFPELFHWFNP